MSNLNKRRKTIGNSIDEIKNTIIELKDKIGDEKYKEIKEKLDSLEEHEVYWITIFVNIKVPTYKPEFNFYDHTAETKVEKFEFLGKIRDPPGLFIETFYHVKVNNLHAYFGWDIQKMIQSVVSNENHMVLATAKKYIEHK